MPRALFFPSYLGGGFGHIGRCLALSEALERRGWMTAIALGGPHLERVGGHDQRRIYPLHYPRSKSRRVSPAFTVLADLNYQVTRDGLDTPGRVRAAVAEGLAVVRSFRPDVLIADTWLPARLLGHLAGLPLVQIVRSIVDPCGPGLLWWRERPLDLVSPDVRPAFNPLLERWGLAPIDRAEELLVGDLRLVPSIPELDPLPEDAGVYYTGPLVRAAPLTLPNWLEELSSSLPVVFASAGGGAEGVGGPAFTSLLIEALQDLDVQAIIAAGARGGPADLPALSSTALPGHIRIERWVPGPSVIARSDLVIFPGGYGTMMEMVMAGTPGLAIPFHSEQESNARRLEAAGAAYILMPVTGEPSTIWWKGRGSRYSVQFYPKSMLTAQAIRYGIIAALGDKGLHQGIHRLRSQAACYDGPDQAAELVEKLLKSGQSTAPVVDRLSWWEKIRLG